MGLPRGQHDKRRDWSINREAVKALVAVYGPREAARQAKIPYGTVAQWCMKFKWKKASRLIHTSGKNGDPSVPMKDDAGDALVKALRSHKEVSTLNLAHYTARAARQAANLKDPLDKARNVRDVATIYDKLWPQESQTELIESAILIGSAVVKDNPQEMLAATQVIEDADVREDVSDQGSQGD